MPICKMFNGVNQLNAGSCLFTMSSLALSVPHLSTDARQYWATNPTKEACHTSHRQAGGENYQTWQLANPVWYPQPTIATTDIQEAAVAGLATNWTNLTTKVDGGKTESRLQWCIHNPATQ